MKRIALVIGEELALAADELHALGNAALLHDVGKLAVPDEVLLKPARLTEDEWALMRRHPDDGARMLADLGLPETAIPAVRHHHEHFDGSGYPDGLAGEEIPLAARIVHVADALDSMLHARIYRPGRPARAALAELLRESGRQFCPTCVGALRAAVSRGRLDALGLTPSALFSVVG